MNTLYKLKIFLLRVIGYEKPLRVAFLKYLQVKFKTFKPHYETILLESCKEVKKLGIDNVCVHYWKFSSFFKDFLTGLTKMCAP